ncbi:hypothetical protein EGW08_005946 [Elysia chlorotica]|uniref:SMB domain-containing protein n=1 Tax=Elysia chlorotica TaxID=188477 RepID=A0A3S1BL87_ELYCH|nr:hypothetical protein EGW08_005946 [Elysia chlorotica]
MLLSVDHTLVALCCFLVCTSQSVCQTWDHDTEHWEDFSIRYCGMVCVNGTLVNLNEYLCPYPKCFTCDCRPLCAALDTCCPSGSLLPNGTFLREPAPSMQNSERPLYADQVECLPIPLDFFDYLQVVRCPPTAENQPVTDSEEAEFRELCERESNTSDDLHSFLSYVDIHDGLIFKNKYCALCNGYQINESLNISWSEVDTETLDHKTAVPWPVHVKCPQFQELYALTSEVQFVRAARSLPYCKVFYEAAPSTHAPRGCFSSLPEQYDAYSNCSEPVLRLCHDLNHRYLGVSGHKNIFCAMCAGVTLEVYRVSRGCTFSYTSLPIVITVEGMTSSPLSLLLGASKINRRFKFPDQSECSAKSEWRDETVGIALV